MTESGDIREEFQKDLLRHVARRALVAREAQSDRPHTILVGVEQCAKSFAIPLLTGLDQKPLARHVTHYGAPFHKLPEVAHQIPVADSRDQITFTIIGRSSARFSSIKNSAYRAYIEKYPAEANLCRMAILGNGL